MVAALVKSADVGENWIVAEVIHYSSDKITIDDIDEDQRVKHTLSRRRIIPLPLMRANPETDGHCLFPKNTTVLALYPQTTCFYRAVINQLPVTANDDYEVLFEDSQYVTGYSPALTVAQRYVISLKHSKTSKTANA